jgi:streptomycin 6-kinase
VPQPDLVPATLPVVAELGRIESGRLWLAGLPALIEQVRDEFGLQLSAPLHGGSCSWVAPARLPDGTAVVVKIGWPHREMYGEPAALRLWDGRGAVRLLGHDPRRHALLLERCEPGRPLATSPGTAEDRLRAGCAVLRLLWEAASPAAGAIDELGAVAAEWADLVEERMARVRPGYDAGLVAEGVRLLRDLPGTAARRVLLHGDFNPGNILSCHGGRWLAIDPKPMVGDPAYDPWPLLQQVDDPFTHPDPATTLRRRIGLTAGELSLPDDRVAQWAVARGVETALWSAQHGDLAAGATAMAQARLLADL